MTRHPFTALCFAATTATLLLTACTTEDAGVQEALLPDFKPDETAAYSSDAFTMPVRLTSQAMEKLRRDASADSGAVPASHYLPVPTTRLSHEQYEALDNNEVQQTDNESVSTFSIDVDTGSYSNIRRYLQQGSLPPADAVRVEEMLNYFSYDYPAEATVEQPFSLVTELGTTPWNAQTKLLHIGLKGFVPPHTDSMAANLVFLVDVSGSMNSPNKLGLLKSSIGMLANELDERDTVSIVAYAGSSGVALPPTAGNRRAAIYSALLRLQAGGSTNGAGGIQLAYKLAAKHFIKGGVNRVILATDGDFNVGISDTEALKKLISQKRESGIALTTLGFGTGNYNDHLMEQLADTGNGTYAYIDTLAEARKVLVDERYSTMMRIAGDVKIQVEFNPQRISEYRLIGYTNRLLTREQFNNDKVDAGDIGAGHTVTALYEVALRGEGGEQIPALRYKQPGSSHTAEYNDELAEIRLRYKLPGEQQSRLISEAVHDRLLVEQAGQPSANFRFSASVAALGQLLRSYPPMDAFDYQDVRDLAKNSTGDDEYGYRAEFVRLVDMAESLDRMQRAANGIALQEEG